MEKKKVEWCRASLLACTAFTLIGVAGLGASPAHAQSQEEDSERGALEEVVVTGSRIKRAGLEGSTPVTTVEALEFQISGSSNAEDLLNTLPQFVPSAEGTSRSNSPGTGLALIDLRGFGPQRNLVLVNGRRFTIADTLQRTDINTIPSALVERMEIVTGGSSAVYGSDAITGVVNFIMRDDFEGIELDAQTRWDSRDQTPTNDFNLTMGSNLADGKGNIVLSVNYLKRDELLQGARDFSRTALVDDFDENGNPILVPGGSGFVPNSRLSGLPTGSALDVRGREGLATALIAAGLGELGGIGFIPDDSGLNVRPFQSPEDLFNFAPDNFLQVPLERWAITAFGHYDFDEKATGYVEASFSNNRINREQAPSPMNGAFLFAVDNPFLSPEMQEVLRQADLQEGRVVGRVAEPDGTVIDPGEVCRYAAGPDPSVCDSSQGLFVTPVVNGASSLTTTPGDGFTNLSLSRRLEEAGPRRLMDDRNAWRVALGLRGDLGDLSANAFRNLSYDIYYSFARTENTSRTENVPSRSGFQRMLLPGSAPDGGTLGNIFGPNLSEEAVEVFRVGATDITISQLQVAAGSISGDLFDLPAGPLGASFGFEWRSSKAGFTPDEFLSSGDVAGFGAQSSTTGKVEVKELFGELRAPLLEDLPFMESLTANAAFRWSDYDIDAVGSVWTYLGGIEWRVSPDLALRGQFQRAIRAPSVGELFDDQTETAFNATDPCSLPSAASDPVVRELCVQTGVPVSLVGDPGIQPNTQVTALVGGNPNLDAEESDTITFGAIITPQAISGLIITVDYFDIKLEDAIDILAGGASNALNLCFNTIQDINSAACQSVVRNPANGEITTPFNMLLFNTNIGKIQTTGIDLGASYSFEAGFGLFSEISNFDISVNGTWLDTFDVTPVQDLPEQVNRCAGAFGNNCGSPKPEWKAVSRVTWVTGPLSLSLRHRYLGSVRDDKVVIPQRLGIPGPSPEDINNPRFGDQHYLDLSFIYGLTETLEFYGGVNNLLDNDPPVTGGSASQANTFPSVYDVLGPEFYLGAKVVFN
ncbi:MAG: TonB-dependent receptor [Xanthomonadales bacterium]|nr:TonB-dependent receptor [Xanthomonadales bacterium]